MTYDSKVKLLTLIKLISFVKFESREFESRYFAGSPIVGEILSELEVQFNSGKEIAFEVDLDSPFGKTLINSIKWHLRETEEWENMEVQDKLLHIVNLASPYKLEDETIQTIMVNRDVYCDNFTNED